MSVRLVLVVLLCLSLMAPVAATGAPGAAAPPATDTGQFAGGKASGCHDQPSDPAPAVPSPTPAPNDGDCCPGCDCDCGCPIGKGMAIGPGHLAGVVAGTPDAPVLQSLATAFAGPSLRPPIGS